QNSTRACAIGRQVTEERTTPVSTCPVPVLDRCGGSPVLKGPPASCGVGAHRAWPADTAARPADAGPAPANAAAARSPVSAAVRIVARVVTIPSAEPSPPRGGGSLQPACRSANPGASRQTI